MELNPVKNCCYTVTKISVTVTISLSIGVSVNMMHPTAHVYACFNNDSIIRPFCLMLQSLSNDTIGSQYQLDLYGSYVTSYMHAWLQV